MTKPDLRRQGNNRGKFKAERRQSLTIRLSPALLSLVKTQSASEQKTISDFVESKLKTACIFNLDMI